MKKILFGLLLTCSFIAKAQEFNNEWIDYSKTYYKFKVGKTGLFRITQPVLASAGLSSTPAEYFQLWRNGVQIPIYTSVPAGTFSGSDYIEFWGQMNDGKPDKQLYRDTAYQLNDKWSLETDTAAYFLTINSSTASNLRLQPATNNVAGNSLPAEPFFMHTIGMYYKDKINPGYAVNVGDYLYSASYDKGEGWTSADIGKNASISSSFNNLLVYTGGPSPKFKISTSGNAINPRRFKVTINADSVIGNEVDFFSYSTDTTTFSINTLVSNTANVTISNFTQCPAGGCAPTDRLVVHKFEITYPRQFNFGGENNFEFTLPQSTAGNFLQIANFSYGAATPVLYDVTNGKRYLADVSAAPVLKFALLPSSLQRTLVLVNQEAANISPVTLLETRNFINYSQTINQGDYLIISSPLLFNGSNGTNPVEAYRAYRSSAAGGTFNAKIYLVDELVDQFGFGIKKNPSALRNFIRFARATFVAAPRYVFIIGRGVNYVHQRIYESNPGEQGKLEKLNLVPTFGFPASDVLLTAKPGSSIPEIPIGRLSAIEAPEVELYFNKIKEFEMAQATISPAIEDKAWMKNVVHIIGASDPSLQAILEQYMKNYRDTISKPLFGANVTTFSKSSSEAIEQLNNTGLQNLFTEGISLITYFGHSSATTLEFNLDNPENYNNQGKYPMFIGLGCNAGNFFNYSPIRFQTKETLSEKYVLSPNRGTIAFIASTHFGIVHYLEIWNSRAYRRLSNTSYGKSIGEVMKETVEDVFNTTTQEDFYARANSEETELHGDPAITINPHAKADYVIEEPMVKISPGFISVADASFKIGVKMLNMGRSVTTPIVVEVKRQYPDQTVAIIQRDTIPGIQFMDSVSVIVPIDPTHDKGLNKITVTVNADNSVDEAFKTNNSITKDVMIYEDEARPVYPYNFAIINKQNIKLITSTANPFSISKQYQMEMDTTALFNSSFKVTKTITSAGGTMEFDPAVTYTDSTVYYWRVAPVVTSGNFNWNTASFVYLPNSDVGYNQSHLYQHFKSNGQKISLDSTSRMWNYGTVYQNLFLRLGTWVTSGATQQASLSVAVNGVASIRLTCWFQSLVFNVFDPISFKPMLNTEVLPPSSANPLGVGLYGSADPACFGAAPRQYSFEYRYTDTSSRRKMMEFMTNVIPKGSYVVIRNFTLNPTDFPSFPIAYASDWAADTSLYGAGKSLYHYLKNAGLGSIDSFYRARPFGLVYKKGDAGFTPQSMMAAGVYDNPTLSVDAPTPDILGYITSPNFGPAKAWKQLKWRGTSMESTSGDYPTINILGVKYNGQVDTLFRNIDLNQSDFDISSIPASQYPYVQLRMRNTDTSNFTPFQLKYWRLTYDPAPEGAIAPNLFFSMKDTLDVAEPVQFKVAFKNISETAFTDSVKVRLVVTDRNNNTRVLPDIKLRTLPSGDTLNIRYPADTRQLVGANSMYVEVNPNNDQPEQYHFNNFLYKNFYVRGDSLNPLMDVTFDNVHILNRDIVSSKPSIMIQLKDEAKWFLLNDTSTVNVQVRFPDGNLHPYNFRSDTMQYTPAQQGPNSNNTATVNLKPYFPEDGEYELIVSGRDMSQNKAGNMQYRVFFQVINKPMISNMLNYPNPFTTSTAFVFTVTGSEVPQNIKIQILTITGKVIREVTKDELGPIHIGRNITEFKWDGTDQYGQKVGNGVYLYRVVTNLNGKSLDKYTSKEEATDKYFNKGYGKMYLMR